MALTISMQTAAYTHGDNRGKGPDLSSTESRIANHSRIGGQELLRNAKGGTYLRALLGGAKHRFRWPPRLTISSGLGLSEGAICSTICTHLGEKYVLHPPLAFSRIAKISAREAQKWLESQLNSFAENRLRIASRNRNLSIPKGPKIRKNQDLRPGLQFSSEIENFKRATHQTPFLWVPLRPKLLRN